MRSIQCLAGLAVGTMLLSGVASAQLSKGRGPGSGPSTPPQSGPKNPPKEDPRPPQTGGPKTPPKEDPRPPQTGGPKTPPKEDPRPPQTGGPKLPPREDPRPPQTGGPKNPPKEDPTVKGGGSSGGSIGGGYQGGNSGDPIRLPPRTGNGPVRMPPVSGGGSTGRQDDPLVKFSNGRNPKGGYGGSSNNAHTVKAKSDPIVIRQPPISLPSMVDREENVRRRGNIYRTGYYHYDPYWCDDFFWFSRYIFDPFRTRCVVSPWYWYASLPGYLNYSCVRILTIPVYTWQGNWYSYRRPSNWGYYDQYYRRSELDYALDDLISSFENQDRRALSRLIPRSGRVHLYANGRYDYSLEADDYYNLMLDGIFNVDTRRYEVVSVETYRDEVEVTARHDFSDPWGRRTSVYHWYRLQEDRRGYVITSFGTSDRGW